jgi:hypothetical protein
LCFLVAGIGAMPVLARASVLTTESFVISSGAGQSGSGGSTSEMVYNGVGPDGISWSGGAVGVQGALSQTLSSRTGNPVYAVAANVAFKYNGRAVVDSLNALYEAGKWTIANPTLSFQYTLYANNPRFGAGAGTFSIEWVANNSWAMTESTTDNTNAPYAASAAALSTWSGGQALLGSETYTWTTPGYTGTYNDLGTSNWTTDKTGSRQSTLSYSLGLDPAFVNDILSASAANDPNISLYLMATSPTLGLTIFTGGAGMLPTLSFQVVTAPVPTPIPPAFLLFGSGIAGLGFLRRRILA